LSDYRSEGTGLAIGNSTILKTLEIEADVGGESFDILFRGVALNRSIELFNLYKGEYETECHESLDLSPLAPFFRHNHNLRFLLITGISSRVMKTLISVLPECKKGRLQYISFQATFCSREDSKALFDSLHGISTLLEISFKDNDIGKIEGNALSNLLKSPTSAIENLTLGATHEYSVSNSNLCESFNVEDEGIACLGDALTINKSLKHLDLTWNECITLEGWQGFARSLSIPNKILQTIVLSQCEIDDQRASVIATALAEKTSVKVLDMSNNSITLMGLVLVFNILLNCKPSLEKLVLIENEVYVDQLTNTEWNILSLALCNNSSIDMTYSSNHHFHTLELSYRDEEGIPDDILSLMQMNKNEIKSEIAHQKILKHHFLGGDAVRVVTSMPEMLLPFVVGWIGRSKHGYSAMHNLVRGMPTLFDVVESSQVGLKRKR
jgi:hypothetical protein